MDPYTIIYHTQVQYAHHKTHHIPSRCISKDTSSINIPSCMIQYKCINIPYKIYKCVSFCRDITYPAIEYDMISIGNLQDPKKGCYV